MISLIIPSYNNLRHLKNVFTSIKKHAPYAEVILLDDGSSDDTWNWIQTQDCVKYRSETRVGHTILYDKGIELATNEIVGILHADMIIGPNYVENILKHLKPGTVVCGTRVEPPLHPEGKEKIIRDFGLDFDSLNVSAFEQFCVDKQIEYNGQTTKGMFAPWVLYKKDFQAIGGHDPLFAPFPYEDSDIFQRWILAGYKLIQSRDSFVYHLTCRGHRWTGKIGENDGMFKMYEAKAARNYIRKWGIWIENDEYQYPIITPKYDIGISATNCTITLVKALEPWCTRLYVEDRDGLIAHYIDMEQSNTLYDLHKRVCDLGHNNPDDYQDVVVKLNCNNLTLEDFNIITILPKIIKDTNEVGKFQIGNLDIEIFSLEEKQNDLIKL
jgi:glycosyltransferase involved in cell wall biosynthesis